MKKSIIVLSITFFLFGSVKKSSSQLNLEYLGLKDSAVTSLSIYDGIIAVGTDTHGVFWQAEYLISENGWNYTGLKDKSVQSVYAHKSGPIGWAIGAGVAPEKGDSIFIYCSFTGQEFRPLSSGIFDSLTTCITALDGFPDPTICGETYAAGGMVLYRRFFMDTVWHPVYITTHEGNINTVIAKEQYPGVVLAGGAEGFAGILIIKSLDYGENWTNISPIGMITSIDFAGDSAQVIFAVSYSEVFKTTDGGKNWKAVFDNVGHYWLRKILYDPLSSGVFVAGGEGWEATHPILFFSQDGGDDWDHIPLEIEGPVVDMEFGNDGWIYLDTPTGGIFRFKQDIMRTDFQDKPEAYHSFKLEQNYPNPFNILTTISYTLYKPDHVELTIYNIRGQEIIKLIDRSQNAGYYNIKWDASGLNSGLYFYELKSSGLTQIRKMLLLK